MNDEEKRRYDAYEELVEALNVAIEVADLHPQHAKYAARWRDLLTRIGEQVPPEED
jgi:hypothetical protein